MISYISPKYSSHFLSYRVSADRTPHALLVALALAFCWLLCWGQPHIWLLIFGFVIFCTHNGLLLLCCCCCCCCYCYCCCICFVLFLALCVFGGFPIIIIFFALFLGSATNYKRVQHAEREREIERPVLCFVIFSIYFFGLFYCCCIFQFYWVRELKMSFTGVTGVKCVKCIFGCFGWT